MPEETVTLTMPLTQARELLYRLLDSPMTVHDAHEWFLIVALADQLGEPVTEWMRKRAAVFA